MFQNVIFGWIVRRAFELGGTATILYGFYAALPPYVQDAIVRIISGEARPEHYALALGGLIIAGVGYVWSFRSTVKPQVVTADKRQIPLSPVGAAEAEAVAKLAPPRKRTLIDVLMGR